MILLDTHVWLWWLLNEGPLSDAERDTLDDSAEKGKIAISAATIWETEMLARKKKVTLRPDVNTWIKRATQPGVCKVIPINRDIILAQTKLPRSFHDDPADRLIVATALHLDYPLATKDSKLQDLGF